MCVPPVIAPGAPRPPTSGCTHLGPRPPARMFHEPRGQACGPHARPSAPGRRLAPSCPGVTARPAASPLLLWVPASCCEGLPGSLPLCPYTRTPGDTFHPASLLPPTPCGPRGLGPEPAPQSVTRALPRAASSTPACTGSLGGEERPGGRRPALGMEARPAARAWGWPVWSLFAPLWGGLSGGPCSTLAKPAFRGAGTRYCRGHLD